MVSGNGPTVIKKMFPFKEQTNVCAQTHLVVVERLRELQALFSPGHSRLVGEAESVRMMQVKSESTCA